MIMTQLRNIRNAKNFKKSKKYKNNITKILQQRRRKNMSRKKRSVDRSYQNGINYRTYNDTVVECALCGAESSFRDFIAKLCKDSKFVHAYGFDNYTSLPELFRGFAFCNKKNGDVFNEEEGKRIALERCMKSYHNEFNKKIIEFIEELHTIEARLFNRLRKNGQIDLYLKAKDVDEIYDSSFIMEGQPTFTSLLLDNDDFLKQYTTDSEESKE